MMSMVNCDVGLHDTKYEPLSSPFGSPTLPVSPQSSPILSFRLEANLNIALALLSP